MWAQVRLLVSKQLGELQLLEEPLWDNGASRALGDSTGGSGVRLTLSRRGAADATGAANDVVLPAEYQRVISQLKDRGEKGHMILALSEVSSEASTHQACLMCCILA